MIEIDLKAALGAFRLDAQLEAPEGLTALFGPSGAGKTSIVRAVAGLVPGLSGRIRIGERTLFDSDKGVNLPPHRRRVGYVFQDARLFPHLTVRQNLRYGGKYREAETVDLLGLSPLLDRRPAGLSGGEAQRVALGRALMSRPDILLLDEPLAALDGPRRDEIMSYLERLRDSGGVPMLFVSHGIGEVARLANTLAVVRDGRVLTAGPVTDVLADPHLLPLIGVADAGAVLEAEVMTYDATDDLTTLALTESRLVLPGHLGAVGDRVRLRVPAQQVILARTRPRDISAQNIVAGRITDIEEGRGPGVAVAITSGSDRLLARITRRSARDMALAVGQPIYAIVKATAIGRSETGQVRGRGD